MSKPTEEELFKVILDLRDAGQGIQRAMLLIAEILEAREQREKGKDDG